MLYVPRSQGLTTRTSWFCNGLLFLEFLDPEGNECHPSTPSCLLCLAARSDLGLEKAVANLRTSRMESS